MADFISREAMLELIDNAPIIAGNENETLISAPKLSDEVYCIPAADVRPVPEGGIGEMSDGYHTFNGLYYQRMVLFASLVNAHQDKAWKSWKHEDGKPCFDGGWFIVGIDTPQGSYTYHYEDKYWNWFECEELPVAKHWDGHTEEDVTRLMSLDVQPMVRARWVNTMHGWECSHCHVDQEYTKWFDYCPYCGAHMIEDKGDYKDV